MHFWHGIQRAVLSRVFVGGTGKTFVYRFDVVTDYNYFKKFSNVEELSGAAHGDDLAYLFHGTYQTTPAIDSKAFECIKKMVSIYTTFASTGNPNNMEIGDVEWKPVTSMITPLNCLNITADDNKVITLPEHERLAVWDTIYIDQNIPLY